MEDSEPGLDRTLVLWGASGHGKVILDIALATRDFDKIVFIDDSFTGPPREFCGRPLLPAPDFLAGSGRHAFVISIGHNQTRAACYAKALEHGLRPATLIHPSAVISPSARIGSGTVVMPRVVVNAWARIGENSILNTAAVIEHDCRIGDHVHLSPGVLLAGNVSVSSGVHLGIGAVVLPGIEIGESSTIGAGAVVVRSIPAGVTAVGIPAKNRESPLKKPSVADFTQ